MTQISPKPTAAERRYLLYLAMTSEERIAEYGTRNSSFRVTDKTVESCITRGWAQRHPRGGVDLTDAGRTCVGAGA